MSSIQRVPVEVLLDVFQATDPAGSEALQLTCRRFDCVIVQKADILPKRVDCDLVYGSGYLLRLYRAPANIVSGGDETTSREMRELLASGDPSPKGLQEMYQMYGGKTTIRKVHLSVDQCSDACLTQLIQNFPSARGAVCLSLSYVSGLPSDAVLNHFDRLEMIMMIRSVYDDDPFFWNDLFASETFRRVSKVHIMNGRGQGPEVDDGETFDFIADRSLIPADKPRVVSFGRMDDDALSALEHRFNENSDSIGGELCAVVTDNDYEKHVFTNMASGSQTETFAKQFMRDAFWAMCGDSY